MKIVDLKELKKMLRNEKVEIFSGRINYKLSENFSPVLNLNFFDNKNKIWFGETIKVKFCKEFLTRTLKKYYKVDKYDENSLVVNNIFDFIKNDCFCY